MNGSFCNKQGEKFTIEIGDKMSVFPQDKAGYPILNKKHDFYSYDSLEQIASLNTSIDSRYKVVLDNCNRVTPIQYVCLELGIYLTKKKELYEVVRTSKGYSAFPIHITYEKINFSEIIMLLDQGSPANVYGYMINPNIWKEYLSDESILDNLPLSPEEKNIYLTLLSEARKIRSDNDGGYALVKRSHHGSGFVSQIFLIAMAGFSAGVLFIFILSAIKHYM
ncbi:MAG: hypothetical protein IJR82_04955 [Bacilli bacterium]|nr:hypothetical protein [Bacilli bacterium]